MPSMFATVQAQNSLNPELPQALTTDGKGNLNVNAIGGGSGGGGGAGPYNVTDSDFNQSTATSFTFDMGVPMRIGGPRLWRLRLSAALDSTIASTGTGVWAICYARSVPHGINYSFGMLTFIGRTGIGAGAACDVQTIDILYPGGWLSPYWIDPSDRNIQVGTWCNWYINTMVVQSEWGPA